MSEDQIETLFKRLEHMNTLVATAKWIFGGILGLLVLVASGAMRGQKILDRLDNLDISQSRMEVKLNGVNKVVSENKEASNSRFGTLSSAIYRLGDAIHLGLDLK